MLSAENAAAQSQQKYTSNDSFTAPNGIIQVTVEAWGGGAAGGAGKGGIGGGGGGAYARSIVDVSSGTNFQVEVGAGGNNVGVSGGDSKFDNLVVAKGGTSASESSGGSGGQAANCIGTVKWSGGNGGNGGVSNGDGGGGGGGSAYFDRIGGNGASNSSGAGGVGGTGFGNGGAGGTANNGNGLTGISPGGGGGGKAGPGNGGISGPGANGQVVVSYFLLTNTVASNTTCVNNTSLVTVSGEVTSLPVGNYTVTYDLSSPNSATGRTATMSVTTAGTGTFTTSALINSGITTITITSIERGIYKTSYDNSGGANNKTTITVSNLLTSPTAGNKSKIYTGVANTTAITATGNAGETIDWYAGPSGGTPLATGASYTPSAIQSGVYTYYTEARNSAGCQSTRTPVTLTITKATLTITAGNQTVTYGTNAATVTQYGTITVAGFVNGENTSVINGLNSISFNTTYSSSTNAGTSGIAITPVVTGLTAGNYNFVASPGTITITKANQFIDFHPLPATKPLRDFTEVPLEVVASSGLPVTLSLGPGSAATLNGGPSYYLTNIGETGYVTVNATQPGNVNYNAATPVSRTFDVTKLNQEINFPSLLGLTYSAGLSVNLAATATSGLALNYSVLSGPATVSGNVLSITGAGNVVVKASQSGNSTYNAAPDVTQELNVGKGSQTITINVPSGTLTTSSQITASSTSGLPVTLTLGTGSAATSLTYNSGSGAYTLNGIGTSGQIYIVGNQPGDANFLPAAQVIQTIDLNKQNQTITFNSISNKTYGDAPFTLGATASSGLTVSFSVVSGPASLSSNTLTITGAGTVIVKADQNGNGTWNAAPTVTHQFEVFKATPVITQSDITKTFGDASFIVSPTSTSSGSLSFTSSNTNIFTTNMNTINITGTGSAMLTIAQQPTANYIGITKIVSVVVNKGNSTISLTGNSVFTYNGLPQGPAGSVVSGSTGSVTYSYQGTGTTNYGPSSVPPTNAGNYLVVATVEADNNYFGASSSPFPFSINKANASIEVIPYSLTYDATSHTSTGSARGVSGESLSGLVLSGTSHINAGTYVGDVWTFTDVTGNYNNTSGTITNVIGPKALKITAANKVKVYDGLTFSPFTVSYEGFVPGEDIANLNGNLVFGGTAATAVHAGSGYVIHPSGLTSSNYAITFVDGALEITPALLTIVANDQVKCSGDTFVFGGNEFTSGGLKNGETIGNLTLTSSGSNPGAEAGSYAIVPSAATLYGSFDPANYTITYLNGTMLVNALPAVGITGNSVICENETTTLSPTTGGSWISNDPNVALVSNTGEVTGLLPGSTTFTFIETATGCRNTTSVVTVKAPPTATITTTNNPVCYGSNAIFSLSGTIGATVTYTINGGPNSSVVLSGGTATVTLSGVVADQTITLVDVYDAFCSQSLNVSSTVGILSLPVSPLAFGTQICIGNTATITASGAISGERYKWYNASTGGTLLKTSSNHTDNFYTTPILNATTNYWVSIVNASGCESERTLVTVEFPALSSDSQTSSGSDFWIGHVFKRQDAVASPPSDINAFSKYYGSLSESKLFDHDFGGSCFQINSGGTSVSMFPDYFAIKYRMTSSEEPGIYLAGIGSDDGARLMVDGTNVYDRWVQRSYVVDNKILFQLTGNSQLILDFYESAGGNRISFSGLVKVPNNLLSGKNQQICEGETIGEISANDAKTSAPISNDASFSVSYQWQKAVDNSGPWIDIPGASAMNYTPSATIPGTYYFRRKLTVDRNNPGNRAVNATDYSDIATVILDPLPVSDAGEDREITGSLAVALEGNSPASGIGTWSKKSGPGTVVFSDVHANNATVTVGTSGSYSFTWTVANGSCTVSDDVNIAFYEESIWNGSVSANWTTATNWSPNIIPDGTKPIRIPLTPNNPVISNTDDIIISSTLTIQDGAQVTLAAGPTLIFDSGATITTGAGSKILIESGANYLNRSASSPMLEVRQNLTGVKGWRMVASPVETTYSDMFASPLVTQGFSGSTFSDKQPNLLWWSESEVGTTLQSWRIPNALNEAVMPGKGYFHYLFNGAGRLNNDGTSSGQNYSDVLPLTMSANGEENHFTAGRFTYNLTYTSRDVVQTPAGQDNIYLDVNLNDKGWNLVGNPTASTLDWDEVTNGAWVKSNVDNTIYIWDPSANGGNGEYLIWNGSTGTLGNGEIAPFQAFWVHANGNSPGLSFNNAAKSVNSGTFLKSAGLNSQVCLSLTMEGLNMKTASFITLNENGVTGPDPKDAYRLEPMSNTWLALYTQSSLSYKAPLVINNIPLSQKSAHIPLYADAQVAGKRAGGSFILKWKVPANWPEGLNLLLMDHQKKKAISMLENAEYQFNLTVNKNAVLSAVNPLDVPLHLVNNSQEENTLKSAGLGSQAFSIVIGGEYPEEGPAYQDTVPTMLSNYPNPFTNTTTIRFSLPDKAPVQIDVFDIYGRLIETPFVGTLPVGLHERSWSPKSKIPGLFIIRLTSGNTVSTIKALKKE